MNNVMIRHIQKYFKYFDIVCFHIQFFIKRKASFTIKNSDTPATHKLQKKVFMSVMYLVSVLLNTIPKW